MLFRHINVPQQVDGWKVVENDFLVTVWKCLSFVFTASHILFGVILFTLKGKHVICSHLL